MGKKQKTGQRGALKYPKHVLSPQDFLTFVELDEFADGWKSLGLDDEEDMWAIQVAIMANPDGPPPIRGTGGLRKLRFAPGDRNVGKSNGLRVCYVYFEEYALVLLVIVYGHQEKDNLTAEDKQGIKAYIEQSEKWLASRSYK